MSREACVKLNNGYDFPLLGLGTYSPRNDEPWVEAIKDAIDIGYRHFDCASIYGTEKLLGEAIREKIDEGVIRRKDIFVTSKLWNNKHKRESVVPAIKESLKNLGLEYMDLFLIHWPFAVPDIPGISIPKNSSGKVLTTSVDYKVTWKGMEECVWNFFTKSIGLSNFNICQIDDVLNNAKVKPSVVQVECHPYLAQAELISFCKSHNIQVTAYGPLGKPVPPFRGRSLLDDPVIKLLATKYNKTPQQIIIRYQIDREVAVIPKSTNKSRLRENFSVLEFKLSEKDVLVLTGLDKDERFVKFQEYADHKFYPFHNDYRARIEKLSFSLQTKRGSI